MVDSAAFLAYAVLGLIAVGGLSHLLLDVIAHGTPLFFPFSLMTVGKPPQYVVDGGVWAYLTHPIVLLEVILLGLAVLIWLERRTMPAKIKRRWQVASVVGMLMICSGFMLLLPQLQQLVQPLSNNANQ